MYALRENDIADILFQKPGRMSAEILNDRDFFETLSHGFLYATAGVHPVPQDIKTHMRVKLAQIFGRARQPAPHPRAVGLGCLELHTYGYSRAQIETFSQTLNAQVSQALEHSAQKMGMAKDGVEDAGFFLGFGRIENGQRASIFTSAAEDFLYDAYVRALSQESKGKEQFLTPARPTEHYTCHIGLFD